MSKEQKDIVQQQQVLTDEQGHLLDRNEASQEASTEPKLQENEVYLDVPVAPGKPRKKRKFRERIVYESEISPKPSAWPLALAFSVALLLFGLIYNVYFLVIGAVLVVVCIIGWVSEQKKV